MEFKDYPNAVGALKRALALEPENLYALEALVRIQREQPQLPVTLDPSPEAQGPRPRTEGVLMDAVRINPDDLGALGELVVLKREQKKLPEEFAFAERFMGAALEAPRWLQPPAYRFITAAWIDGDDETKIERSLGLAKDLDRRSLEIERLTVQIGRHDFRAKTDPQNIKVAFIEIARARAELKDVAGAQKSLKQALAIVPGDPEALQFLSEISAGAPVSP
jgi:tetratricopeptide (TPR) repeat protein